MVQTIRFLLQISLAHYDLAQTVFYNDGDGARRQGTDRFFAVKFSKVEIEAMERIREEIWVHPDEHPLRHTARLLIRAPLLHCRLFDKPGRRDARYVSLEKFDGFSDYYEGIIKARFTGKMAVAD